MVTEMDPDGQWVSTTWDERSLGAHTWATWDGTQKQPFRQSKLHAEVHQIVWAYAVRVTEGTPRYDEIYTWGGNLVATLQGSYRPYIEVLTPTPPTAGPWQRMSDML
jgi:hypothetical protein